MMTTPLKRDDKRREEVNRLRDKFASAINKSVERLLENFQNILQSSWQMSDQLTNNTSNFRIRVSVANICQSAEQLLKIIADLKHLSILNDQNSLKQDDDYIKSLFQNLEKESNNNLSKIRVEINDMLKKLESSYYHTNVQTNINNSDVGV